MSGFVCVYGRFGIDHDLPRYLSALRRLVHRGQDDEGHHLSPSLFLGVRSNSVGRGATGRQPAFSPDGNVLLAFDGYLHDRDELARSLGERGYDGDLSSDVPLVLGAYREYGEQCFERLKGFWALVVWDRRQQRVLLGRDRLGVRPIYYYLSPRHLVVASEIKSIIAIDPDARAIDHGRVRDLIHDGRIDDWSGTCFARIQPVPPGGVVDFDGTQIKTRRYWNLRLATDSTLTPGDVLEKLVRAVDRHTPSAAKIGLALSGGIDSASLAGILTRSSLRGTRHVHAFSINPPKTTDESFLIDATIRRTGIPHSYVPLGGLDYSRALARMIDFHDEPIQYSGVFYQFVLRKHMADAGCKAVLVGYGADEIFSGYTHLAIPFLAALAAHGRWRDCARFISGASAFLESRLGIVREALRFARGYVKASLLERRKDGILHDIHRRLRARSGDVLLSVKDRWESEPSLPPMEFDLHELDQGRVFFDALLRCFRTNIALLVRLEDRNAMAHGLDLCMPFMDEDLVHAALCFPFHRYMEGGRNKAILRDAAAELLASEVMRYPKKLATPGSDQHLAFEVLRAELLDLLGSRLFCESGLWSRRCRELYEVDLARATRATTWFRVYMVHKWYERVVQSRG